ncbi:MAG: hypothetical protein LBQ48_05465, partial [Oscillospiraceae bacterium]|nr:hypothetical protein [Oscillospiraceae bacterium]
MKKTGGKTLLLLVCAAILAAALVPGTHFTARADESTAVQALITAWQGLTREVTELWAVPRSENKKAVTPEIAAAMGLTESQIGPSYMQIAANNSDPLFTNPYTAPNGTSLFAPLAKYSRLVFRFQCLDEGGTTIMTGKQFEFQFNNSSSTWPNQNTTPSKETAITPASSAFAQYFAGTAVTSIKLMTNNSPPVLRMGCIFGQFTEPVPLPEGYGSLSAEELLEAAETVNTSGCAPEQLTSFAAALTALRAFTPRGEAYNNLISAWQGMSREVTELWAVPRPSGDNRQTATADTATAMGVDLDKIGPYYSQVTWGGTDPYQMLMAYRNALADTTQTPAAPGKYTSVFFMAQALDASGNPLNTTSSIEIMFGYNNNSTTTSTWKTINASTTKIVIDPTTSSGAFAAYFNGTALSTCQVKANAAQTPAVLRVGCFFGVYNEYASLPESALTMGLDELIKAAEALDTSAYEAGQVQVFEAAIETAKPYALNLNKYKIKAVTDTLVSAWSNLSREVTEVWAVPRRELQNAVTPEIAAAMGADESEIGPYYLERALSYSDALLNAAFTAPDGTHSFAPLSKYSLIKFRFQGLETDGTTVLGGKQFELQFNSSTNTWPNQNTSPSKEVTIAPTLNTAFAKYFEGTAVTSIKLMPNNSPPLLRMGSIFGQYTQTATLPADYEELTLPLLYTYAAAVEAEFYNEDRANIFKAALTAARETAETMVEIGEQRLAREWEALGFTVPSSDLTEASMVLDISDIADTTGFNDALLTLRSYEPEGNRIFLLKEAWEKLPAPLPSQYGQMTAAQWIEAANNLDTSGKGETVTARFEYARGALIDYVTTGSADSSALAALIASASGMNGNDFSADSWNAFQKELAAARAVLDNLTSVSQRTVDAALAALLEVWGSLKVYQRYLYMDVNDYYINEPDVRVIFAPANISETYDELQTDFVFPNGLDRAVRVNNASAADKYISFAGKSLPDLKGYEYLELYMRCAEDFNFSGGGAKIQLQIMAKGGAYWADYYINLPST